MMGLSAAMSKPARLIVGLMSGTSLDGIDAAVVRIAGSGLTSKVELVYFHSVAYDSELRERLKDLCSLDRSNTAGVCSMNFELGQRFAAAAAEAVTAAGLQMSDIDLISSHGQTVWHIPELDTAHPDWVRSTLQIGDISVIAKLTGTPVVGDFRTADMAVGGQGAPLTPYGDLILFRDEQKGRIVQNIGGIGNCAAIPADGQPEQIIAFDTGPGNMLIDQAVIELSGGRLSYDEDGRWGAQGRPHAELLASMLSHPYFSMPPVKTTGREMFGKAYAAEWLSRMNAAGLSAEDIVVTFTAFTAQSIASGYRNFVLPHYAMHEVIVSGGGAHNGTLMRMLGELLPEQRILSSDELGVSSDAKEAICFAIFGNNMLHGVPNNLPAATGAAAHTIMGKLALP